MIGHADLFVDTAGWAALLDSDEPPHAAAVAVDAECKRTGRRLVTTSLVIAEFVSLSVRLRLDRAMLIGYVDGIRASSRTEIIHVEAELQAEAWNLLKSRPDKTWTLVDCASFVVMERRGLTEALTSDHHFVQAGFTALLAG